MRQTNSGMDQQLRRQEILVCHLGRADYEITWNLQKRLQARLIEAKRSGVRPLPPHILLTVEHPPVFTIGKSGNRANLLFNAEALAKRGATFFEIDRGGDITFHGRSEERRVGKDNRARSRNYTLNQKRGKEARSTTGE